MNYFLYNFQDYKQRPNWPEASTVCFGTVFCKVSLVWLIYRYLESKIIGNRAIGVANILALSSTNVPQILSVAAALFTSMFFSGVLRQFD